MDDKGTAALLECAYLAESSVDLSFLPQTPAQALADVGVLLKKEGERKQSEGKV
jgi:hypothetical protein